MTNPKELMPKNKGDMETSEKLKNYSFEELEPAIPELLEWLQDINWEVSGDVARALIPFTDRIWPQLKEILDSTDGIWKYYTVSWFGPHTQNPEFIAAMQRIATAPDKYEKSESVDEKAREVLEELGRPIIAG